MKLIYICSPLKGNIEENIKKAKEYCTNAVNMGVISLAPHVMFSFDDNIPQQREKGLAVGLNLLRECEELWVCGNIISQGMRNEIQFARQNSISIKYMKEVSVMDINHAEFSVKQHSHKSQVIQQYRPIYSVNYNITVSEDGISNIARVLFDNGKSLELKGNQYGFDFTQMHSAELRQAIDKIVTPMITEEQNRLWQEIGLDAYPRIYPIQDTALPYFILDKNEDTRFGYCPVAENKFMLLIHNDFGHPFMDADHRMFGTYDNQLHDVLIDECKLNYIKVIDILKEFEPDAVEELREAHIFQKLQQMQLETGARPFVFPGDSDVPSLVSLPVEAEDYLTPEEMKLAEELITRQEQPEQEESLEETPEQDCEDDQDFDEEMEEEYEPEMSM